MEGAHAGRRHSPPGLQAQRWAAWAARAAGAQQAWALAAGRQTARQRRAVTPRRPGVTPADSQGSHRVARASVLTRASARGSVISPCGTSWRRRGNRRPVAPGASRRAGTMDRGTRAPAAGGGGASGRGYGSRGVARSRTERQDRRQYERMMGRGYRFGCGYEV